MKILNSKTTEILTDLIPGNIKLIGRLGDKLKVSNLFNNIEHRNLKYLKDFIFLSNRRAHSLKVGLSMKRTIKQNIKNIQPLSNQIKGDVFLQNSDLFLSEKKLLKEDTEMVNHIKLKNLLEMMKKAIKPSLPYRNRNSIDKNRIKVLTEDEMVKMKDYIGNKISKEQSDLKTNISNYVSFLNNTLRTDDTENKENKFKEKKEFNRFTRILNHGKNIRLINYKKPMPQPIKEKEPVNLKKIKKIIINLKKKGNKEENTKIEMQRNASMNNIYNENNNRIFEKTAIISNVDKFKNIDVNGQDTMQIIRKLDEQKNYLPERLNEKLKRVNSLTEIKLPFISNYDNIMKYIKRKNESISPSNNISKSNNTKRVFLPISKSRNNISEIRPFMRTKIISLKDDIQNINYKNELFNKKFFEDERMVIYNKMKESLEKINRKIYRIKEYKDLINKNTDQGGNNVFNTK